MSLGIELDAPGDVLLDGDAVEPLVPVVVVALPVVVVAPLAVDPPGVGDVAGSTRALVSMYVPSPLLARQPVTDTSCPALSALL